MAAIQGRPPVTADFELLHKLFDLAYHFLCCVALSSCPAILLQVFFGRPVSCSVVKRSYEACSVERVAF